MPRDNLVDEPMFRCAGAYPLALCTYTDQRHRTIDRDALKIHARRGGICTNGIRCFSISG